MTARGLVYPFQRIKQLEKYIEENKESFYKEFLQEDDFAQHVAFMSDGCIVQVIDNVDGSVTFKYVEGSAFKRWLRGY